MRPDELLGLLDKVPKEEPIDESFNPNFELKDPKLEPMDEDESYGGQEFTLESLLMAQVKKEEIQDQPTSSKSLLDKFKQKEREEELDLDMDRELLGLGTSILFDDRRPRGSPSDGDFYGPSKNDSTGYEYPYELAKKPLPPTVVKKGIAQAFKKNPHPTASEIQKISEDLVIRYKTVYDTFVEKRKAMKIKCPEGDPCRRIKGFFLREGELLNNMVVTDETRRVLEDDLETQILSRKRFNLGCVHMIMEKTELPPAYIRGQYEGWKKKLLTKERDSIGISEWRRDTVYERNTIPIETLRKLESAYLAKKYQCEDATWSPKDIKSVAKDLAISEAAVMEWMEKRQSANLGLDDDVIRLRREVDEKRRLKGENRRLPRWKVIEMEKFFAQNNKPNLAERTRIANKVDLSVRQITNYFNKKRIAKRKIKMCESAQREIRALTMEQKRRLELAALQPKLSVAKCETNAAQIGVSVTAFIAFRRWRRMNNTYN